MMDKGLVATSLPTTPLVTTLYITADYGVVFITVIRKGLSFLKKLF